MDTYMYIVMLLATFSVAIAASDAASSTVDKCDGKITVLWPNSTVKECLDCFNCKRGWGAPISCRDIRKAPLDKPLKCVKCEKGYTFSLGPSNIKCRTCKSCGRNIAVLNKCTQRADTVCGTGCKDGFYKHTDLVLTTCERCSSCCGDSGDQRMKECEKQGLPSNMQCSYLQEKRCNPKYRQADKGITNFLPTVPSSTNQSSSSTTERLLKTSGTVKRKQAVKLTEPNDTTADVKPPKISGSGTNINVYNSVNHDDKTGNEGLNIGLPTGIVGVVVIVVASIVVIGAIIHMRKRKRRGKKSNSFEMAELDLLNPDVSRASAEIDVANGQQHSANVAKKQEERDRRIDCSIPIGKFYSDKNARLKDISDLIDNERHPNFVNNYETIVRSLGITDPNTINKLRRDEHGPTRSLLNFLSITQGSAITIELVAGVFDEVGRLEAARILREEDVRLQNEKLMHHDAQKNYNQD